MISFDVGLFVARSSVTDLASVFQFGFGGLGAIVVCMKSNTRWSIAPLLSALSGCGHISLPDTPLFDGIDDMDYSQGSRLIQGRLEAEFPKGSSDLKLLYYLEQQGLRVVRTEHSSASSTGVASFKFGGFICGSQVRVIWDADAARTIQSIHALYSDTGCP